MAMPDQGDYLEACSYLAGTLDGDGFIYERPKDICFGVTSVDDEIIKVVTYYWQRLFDKILRKRILKRYSLRHKIRKQVYTYNRGDVTNFKSLLKKTKFLPSFYLRGLFDSEGSASDYRNSIDIRLVTMHEEIYTWATNFLKELGIELNKPTFETTKNGVPVYRIRIKTNHSNVKRFYEEIKPSIKRKVDNIIKYLNRGGN